MRPAFQVPVSYRRGNRDASPIERQRPARRGQGRDDFHATSAEAQMGHDPLFLTGKIIEIGCNVHSRRKFVEAADLLEKPGRPHEALKFYKTIFRIERRIKHLSD